MTPPPPRPAPRTAPCSNCDGIGLQPGPPPTPLSSSSSIDDVAVIGGGIGGAALALALQQRGITVRIYERDRCFAERAQGYGLTMQQGATALARLGVPNVGVFSTAHHSFLPDGTMIGSYGRAVYDTTREIGGNGKGEQQRRNAHIPRQQLRESLLCRLAEGTVQWGRRFAGYEEDADGVSVSFADGTGARARVLVGADGIWSAVRSQRLANNDSSDPPPRYMGVVVLLGRAPCRHPLAQEQIFQTLDGDTRLYAMPFTAPPSSSSMDAEDGSAAAAAADRAAAAAALVRDESALQSSEQQQPGVTMWQLSFRLPEDEAVAMPRDGAWLKAEALRRCAGWHAPIPQLLNDTQPEDITGYPAYDREPLRVLGGDGAEAVAAAGGESSDDDGGGDGDSGSSTSSSGPHLVGGSSRVTLLGDAAHPMSPFKGQGANQALVDAIGLAKSLRASELCGGEVGLHAALASYEMEMMRRAKGKVLKSREAAEHLHCEAATHPSNSTRAAAARGIDGRELKRAAVP